MTGRARLIVVLSVVTMLAVGITGSAFAGGGKGGGTLKLVLMNGATQAQYGGEVTFEVSTNATDKPFVGLRCWQGTAFVFDGYVGYFAGAWGDQWFVLDSSYWVAGIEASCTARLFYYSRQGRERVLKTLDFPVAP